MTYLIDFTWRIPIKAHMIGQTGEPFSQHIRRTVGFVTFIASLQVASLEDP